MKTERRELLYPAGAVIVTCLCLLAVILGSTPSRLDVLRTTPSYRELDSFSVEERSIDEYAGVETTYTTGLPEVNARGEELFIYLVHQYAEVWIDDELAAECREPEGWTLGRTPGCYWLSFGVTEADSGGTLRIVTRPLFRNVADRAPRAVISDWRYMIRVWISDASGDLLLSLLCLVGGLVYVIIGLAAGWERRTRVQLSNLGAFTMAIGMWHLFDIPVVQLVLSRHERGLYFLTMVGVLTAPIFFTRLLYWRKDEDRPRGYRLLGQTYCVLAAAALVLQLLNVLELRAILHYIVIALTLSFLPVLTYAVRCVVTGRRKGLALLHDWVYILMLLSIAADLYRFFTMQTSHFFSLVLVTAVLHLMVMSFTVIRDAREQQRQAYETRAALAEERGRLMLSQIQPHFLYNSLGVIRELCHSDPARAEEATLRFSEFLRRNMDSLSIDGAVRFAEELQHTRNYLALEQLRFGDALRVEYDIQAQDFRLPVLTLQPLAENAVRHGIRKQLNGGTVRISTRELPDRFEVTVEDDGPGFDPERMPEDDRVHVGLVNVQRRLHYICGGRLEIDAAPGRGVRATMIIPKEGEKQ